MGLWHRKAGIEGKNIDNYFLQFEGDNGFCQTKEILNQTIIQMNI